MLLEYPLWLGPAKQRSPLNCLYLKNDAQWSNKSDPPLLNKIVESVMAKYNDPEDDPDSGPSMG